MRRSIAWAWGNPGSEVPHPSQAFQSAAGGVVFAIGYFVLRSLHFVLARLATGADPEWRRATLAVAPNALLITAALLYTFRPDVPCIRITETRLTSSR